jgi:hypothetical protein
MTDTHEPKPRNRALAALTRSATRLGLASVQLSALAEDARGGGEAARLAAEQIPSAVEAIDADVGRVRECYRAWLAAVAQ